MGNNTESGGSYPAELQANEKELVLVPEQILVAFEESRSTEDAAEIVDEISPLHIDDLDEEMRSGDLPAGEGANRGQEINNVENRVWLHVDTDDFERTVSSVETRDTVEWVAPVYRQTDVEGNEAYLAILPHILLIEYQDQADDNTIRRIEEEYDLSEVEEKTEHLGGFTYYKIPLTKEEDAFELRDRITENESENISAIYFETMQPISPFVATPNDTFFNQQWDMARINTPGAWDITMGSNSVTIGVIDSGCDIGAPNTSGDEHPDLNFDGPGFNAATGTRDGSPAGSAGNRPHGTAVAGIAAARIGNNQGVTGVAGNCLIHSVAITFTTNAELAAGINEAANDAGVDVINMSLRYTQDPIIDRAIVNAHDNRDVVLCAATGNDNRQGVSYPARHPNVIAVGASDRNDERKRPESPDRECWGSNWGAEIDVVAPGVQCWSTDIRGGAGYNSNNGGPMNWACVNYSSSGSGDGNYVSIFDGTSAATPHVAGLAALLRSHSPGADNTDIRTTIERSCEKVSSTRYTYSNNSSKPNGSWNSEMGYGRINARRALDAISWSGWVSLGGVCLYGVDASSWTPNRLDVFVTGTDSRMYHKWWDGSAWRGWENLDGVCVSEPAAVSWGNNRIDTFVIGTDNALWHKWWDGSAWQGWESLGGICLHGPAVSSWAPNRLDVFVIGTDNALWHKWWDGSAWRGWESLGGVCVAEPAAVSWGNNRIDTFVIGTDNALWHKWWDGSAWQGWESLGGKCVRGVAASSRSRNRLDVFVIGVDNRLYRKTWDGSRWSNWESLGGICTSAPAAVSWNSSRIDTFVVGTDNALWHKWWSQ